MTTKTFDLEKALSGHPVCTRDLRPARIVCTDMKDTCGGTGILALVEDVTGSEAAFAYLPDGRFAPDRKTMHDLMLTCEKRIGYIVLYKRFCGDRTTELCPCIYPTREDAENAFDGTINIVGIIPIEWEE